MHDHPEAPLSPEHLDAGTLEFLQAVFDAARADDAARLAPLLQRGLPPNLRNQKGDSLLMLASYHGHLRTARLLLEHGADPELRNDQGQTPLLGAAYQGDLSMVRLLLAHHADVESPSPDGRTALMMAAMFGRAEIIEVLLAHGAHLGARDARGMSVADAARLMGAHDTAAELEARMLRGRATTAPGENP
ncbi:ankyrin repeat domain-containing protein (plasmid) [Deinococcus taeanensis]|uniref:ankyrin repeat domain-containing protein n=1 Tax=Deinococcus taeanensis TaxID=2737050 RepID=UPI001CDC7D57|nr:ankyrin repeat domain-containing protein [Deinococcus taeanensis]UBV44735.1 ankyrin repeat domain-containing protein [Deinococcus taeanensis]